MNLKNMRWVPLILLIMCGCAAGTVVPDQSSVSTALSGLIAPSDRIPRITIDELLWKMSNGADIMIIDSRTDVGQQFESGHIKGAIPVPLVEITEGRWIPPADLNKEIVFYCSCPNDKTSATAALELIGRGYTSVSALKGGYNAWKEAGYPLETGPARDGKSY